ncbi:acyl-CoA carboxylase epsilon subunit [Nocardiopsis potens]|uniref:acyl-CoA carboxylase epsilon subunit n=1 Tax=Nocardiopsis potens TaxID=1246458 RepID=UPI00034D2B20|nr:acyl-CoA carboxylase epsilon subunit [Nocardiopsis potens]
MSRETTGEDRPRLSIVRGDASPEEVAALVAVVAARARAAEAARAAAPAGQAGSAWRRSARGPRRTAAPGPGAWRRSMHPE